MANLSSAEIIMEASNRLQSDVDDSALYHSHGRAEADMAIVLKAARAYAQLAIVFERVNDRSFKLVVTKRE